MNLAARSFLSAIFLAGVILAASASAAPAPDTPSPPKSPAPPDAKAPPSFTAITCEVTGGFAGFQQKMTIAADGKFQIRDVRPPKSADGELTKVELAELKKRAAAIDWKSVQPKHVDPRVADAFYVGLTVAVGAETHKTTVSDPPPEKVPQALASLLTYLCELRQKYQKPAGKPDK